jgi:glycosyltransferase involved in cell wall biosynthesis
MHKKVLFVIDSLNCGGAEKSLLSLLPLLNQSKYDISLWILHRGGILESLVPDGIHLVEDPQYSFIEKVKLKIAYLLHSVYIRVLALFHQKQHGAESLWKCVGWATKGIDDYFDVAIAYQQGFPTYLVAKQINAKRKIAWVNADIFNVGYNIKYNIPFYKKYDFIVPVSEQLKGKMESELPQFSEKYRCVYDILNLELIQKMSLEPINDASREIGKKLIVTVARMVPPKGYDIAVETAHYLKEMGIPFRWYFIGSGSEKQHILDMIVNYHLQNDVILLGLKTNPYPYMKLCDVYVQSSRFEGFGLTIAEAKILGKPVVSTNFKVVYDQITDEKNGLISEMEATSLGDQIIRMITDDALRQRIIANVMAEENTTYKTEVVKVEHLLD